MIYQAPTRSVGTKCIPIRLLHTRSFGIGDTCRTRLACDDGTIDLVAAEIRVLGDNARTTWWYPMLRLERCITSQNSHRCTKSPRPRQRLEHASLQGDKRRSRLMRLDVNLRRGSPLSADGDDEMYCVVPDERHPHEPIGDYSGRP